MFRDASHQTLFENDQSQSLSAVSHQLIYTTAFIEEISGETANGLRIVSTAHF